MNRRVDLVNAAMEVEVLVDAQALMPGSSPQEEEHRALPSGDVAEVVPHRPSLGITRLRQRRRIRFGEEALQLSPRRLDPRQQFISVAWWSPPILSHRPYLPTSHSAQIRPSRS